MVTKSFSNTTSIDFFVVSACGGLPIFFGLYELLKIRQGFDKTAQKISVSRRR